MASITPVFAHLNLREPTYFSSIQLSYSYKFKSFVPSSASSPSSQISSVNLFHRSRQFHQPKNGKLRSDGYIRASSGNGPTSDSREVWILEPVGDGDSKHIGYKVPLPGAFEITSNLVTVGRVPDKADLVLPVATVSGVHARLEKKDGSLLVTDLDSTNGTYIDEKKLRPGVVMPALPGSCITFGDTHLAMFRVSKIENAVPTTQNGSSNTDESSSSNRNPENASDEA